MQYDAVTKTSSTSSVWTERDAIEKDAVFSGCLLQRLPPHAAVFLLL
jgi:hypothetical protein